MTTKTNTFEFAGLSLRCVTIDNKPWFVAVDVCRILGLTNATLAVRPLNADEKALNPIKPHAGRNRTAMPTNCVSESGLYKLVMRSDKAQAREFQNWVTGTVLPAIRQDGMYVQGEEKLDRESLSVQAINPSWGDDASTKHPLLRRRVRGTDQRTARLDRGGLQRVWCPD